MYTLPKDRKIVVCQNVIASSAVPNEKKISCLLESKRRGLKPFGRFLFKCLRANSNRKLYDKNISTYYERVKDAFLIICIRSCSISSFVRFLEYIFLLFSASSIGFSIEKRRFFRRKHFQVSFFALVCFFWSLFFLLLLADKANIFLASGGE